MVSGLVGAVGLSALDRYRFDVSGYLLFDGVLDAGEVDRLWKAIDARGLPEPGPTVDQQRFGFGSELLGWHQAFRDLIDHPLVLEVLGDFIGPYARLDHAYGIAMAPGKPAWASTAPVPPSTPPSSSSTGVGACGTGCSPSPGAFGKGLVHCTIPWHGRGKRLSLLYKYSPGNSSWAPYPAAPVEALELLSPRQRRLVEAPYVGGRHHALE